MRIRRTTDGWALGKGSGRGAWLCAAHPVACLDEAQRRRGIARALRTDVDELEALRARLGAG